MRTVLALTAAAALGLSVGCQDEAARQAAQAQVSFEQAMELLGSAEAGYIPESALQGQSMGQVKLADYRQQKLNEAAAALDAVVKDGTAAQKAAAMRLQSAVYESAAAHQARTAISDWAELSGESANILNLLLAIDTADAQVRRFSGDSSALLASLKNDQTQKQDELAKHQKTVAELTAKIDELNKQREALVSRSQSAQAEARKLRTDAFTIQGDAQYAMYDKATEAERRAGIASTEAQILAEKLDVLQAQRGVLEVQIKQIQTTLTSLQNAMQQTSQRDVETRKSYDAAVQDKQTHTDSLVNLLEESSKSYLEKVRQPMIAATEQAQQALDRMKQAADQAPPSSRRDYQLDLLTKHASLAHVLTSHVVVSSDWAHLLDVVAATASQKRGEEALLGTRAAGFQTNALEIKGKQGELTREAKRVINEGLTLAADLANAGAEGDPIAAATNTVADRLQNYSRQLDGLGSASAN